ncbi:MAG TPA: hypothetical protein VKH64_13810 [Candidatus Binatia bacterium]|nr:hypothetical protein [Candidatus Binatia bacterium]
MDEQTIRDFYRDLIRINRESFQGEEFDIAYHTLMSALHCAQQLKDIPYLREVERVANEQLKYIDAHHPEYEHSTVSASNRNHVSVFQTLARQASARVTIIQNTPRQKGNPLSP